MRGILIDPYTETVSELDVGDDYVSIGLAISSDGEERTITTVDFGGGATGFVDDNGLLTAGIPAVGFVGTPTLLVGKILLLGYPNEEGDSTDCPIPLRLVEHVVRWSNLETTGEFNDDDAVIQEEGFTVIQGPTPIYRVRKEKEKADEQVS